MLSAGHLKYAFLLALTCLVAVADEIEFFEKKVRPVLAEHCYECHSKDAKKLKGNLSLDSTEAILRGGEEGKAIVPGKPDQSLMYTRTALSPDDLDIMPAEGEPLDEQQVEIIRRWIAEGADFGEWTAAESE